MHRTSRLAAFLLAALLVLVLAGVAGARAPQARQGVLDVPAVPDRPLALQGQWGFAWQQFVDPAWQQLPTQGFAPVPSSWNTIDGKPAGENGWGSYVLQVNCPVGASLAIEAVGQRTASRLFVNGTEVAAHGRPGPSAQASWAAVHNRVPITREFACPLRLTLQISNFDHRAGGFVRPIWAGPSDVLERAREARLVEHAALLTAYLVTGAVALIFFAVRPREPVPLVFGLFCVAIAVYTDMIGERLFLRPLPDQVSWFGYMRVEYLSWLAAMALFLLTLRGLFPVEIPRRAVDVVLAMLGLASLAVLALPPAVYSYLVVPGQAIAVVVAVLVAVAMLRSARGGNTDARVLLLGMLAVLATLALDLLMIDTPGPDRKFSTLGFALFLLSPAVVIARRMTAALNAEERSRALEENARLREDVERISRHDLKTPLNSILGAARLLRDDARLAPDQQELVGVLQRAGLRMLEMVNLSLGLFRMETGTYALRPAAVNLREVVSRVLVDLHPYAEEHGVALQWRGSHPAPVQVRGEELLCYSIVANLVKNAVEAAGAGAQVDVTLAAGDPVSLSVHNPGAVPPEIARRFFEKYVTGRKIAGTGLGTYSARLMARAQHGELRMRTGAQGTTLTLTLPALKGALPAPASAGTAQAPQEDWLRALPAREVLLVDDDEFTRLVTSRMLPHPPFHVETASNGQAAAEAMLRRWPHYLLLDMEMPLRSGVDTVRWAREHEAAQGLAPLRVIMMSGNDDEASAARAGQAGADRFLVKPVSRERLLAALRELERLQPVRPASAGPSALFQPHPAAPGNDAPRAEDEQVVIDAEWSEVFPNFLQLQRETVDAMAQAAAAGRRDELRFLAHRAYGALGAMGLNWAARQSRALEHGAADTPEPELQQRVRALREHLDRLQVEYRPADSTS
ncbi:response regulator [Ramlibacter alkalitolerans]|uniref:histidine kinase n=1 Tax=Ramlibacter alkalitolerans TaxID=2039631 RepID=A0ABS1JS42_9BURK|nr:response regulator [Ramlibacter alkalitolerans]MBL0427085.1 response regulator [Ramlibacter alkalitolerans]